MLIRDSLFASGEVNSWPPLRDGRAICINMWCDLQCVAQIGEQAALVQKTLLRSGFPSIYLGTILSTCVHCWTAIHHEQIWWRDTGMRTMASETCTNPGPGPGKTSWAWGLRSRRVLSAPPWTYLQRLHYLQASNWVKCTPKLQSKLLGEHAPCVDTLD